MKYTKLGSSGLAVSRIALGCMSFANPGTMADWALDGDAAAPIFRRAVESGVTFWDTANAYGQGSSEEIVGRAICKYSTREDIVLATKVFLPMHDGPGGSGLNRKALSVSVWRDLLLVGASHQRPLSPGVRRARPPEQVTL